MDNPGTWQADPARVWARLINKLKVGDSLEGINDLQQSVRVVCIFKKSKFPTYIVYCDGVLAFSRGGEAAQLKLLGWVHDEGLKPEHFHYIPDGALNDMPLVHSHDSYD